MPVPEFTQLRNINGMSDREQIKAIYDYLVSLDGNLRHVLMTIDEKNSPLLGSLKKDIEELKNGQS